MQEPILAIQELQRCVTVLGMSGVQIGSHVRDCNLDAEELDIFWTVSSRSLFANQ